MKIANSQLTLNSSHSLLVQDTAEASMTSWVGNRDKTLRTDALAPNEVSLSRAARTASLFDQAARMFKEAERDHHQALSLPATSQPPVQKTDKSEDSDAGLDARTKLLRDLIELMTGQRIHLLSASDLSGETSSSAISNDSSSTSGSAQADPSAGFGLDIQASYRHEEYETTDFQAAGKVTTADGQQISFQLNLSMSRSYVEESQFAFHAGDSTRKDPLVLNFSGNAAQLTDQRFSFDLDSDGQQESLPGLAAGSGYLVFDKNHDGKVNNGNELFGPQSQDGFNDLAALDDDHNGWIDENDKAFQDLRVWQPDAKGEGKLVSLKEANVGALALAHAATPFEQRTLDNRDLGATRSSGVWLSEDGQAHTVQQLDLTTQTPTHH